MKIIFKYFVDGIKKFKFHFIKTFLLFIFSALLTIAVPISMKMVTSNYGNEENILFYIGFFILLILFSAFLGVIKTKYMDEFGGEYLKYILKKVQFTLYNTDLKNTDLLYKNGLSHTLFSDTMTIMSTIGVMIPSLISSVTILITLIIVSLFFNKMIALFFVISIIVGVIIAFLSRNKMYKTSMETNIKLKHVHDFTNEITENILDTRHNMLQKYYFNRTDRIISDFINTAKREDIIREGYNQIIVNYNIIIQFTISIILSIPFINNSVSNALFFIMIFNFMITQGSNIELFIGKILSSSVSFFNINSILNLDTDKASTEIEKIDCINVNNLRFDFETKNIIDGLSFSVKKGDVVLVEGSNGTGKSTLLKILLKFYSYCGEVKYNNIDLNEIKRDSLYSKIIYINQKEIIVNEGIENYLNEVLKLEVSKNEITKFLNRLKFENKQTDTLNNKELSGGEIKKVLMAKLFFGSKSRDVILIDEIEAGLDSESLEQLSDIINKIAEKKNKIVLIVSHGGKLNVNYTHILNMDRREFTEVS